MVRPIAGLASTTSIGAPESTYPAVAHQLLYLLLGRLYLLELQEYLLLSR